MTNPEAKALAIVAVSKIVASSTQQKQKWDAVRQSLLSDDEIEKLILNMINNSPDDAAVSEDDCMVMLNEVALVRYLSTCIDLAVKGLIAISLDASAPLADRLVFKHRPVINTQLQELLERPHHPTTQSSSP